MHNILGLPFSEAFFWHQFWKGIFINIYATTMKLLKRIISLFLMLFIIVSFSECASTLELQDNLLIEIDKVYYQTWVAGVKGGDRGINVFIPIKSNSNNIVLDSMYFRGKSTKIEYANDALAIGRFKTKANQKQDIIMSNEPYAEYANKVPVLPEKIPFELKDDECIVSYLVEEETKYFKIEGIIRKASKLYQTVPSKKL